MTAGTTSRPGRSRLALLSALLLAVLAGGVFTAPAQAAPPESSTVPTMIVLDASGSMLADDAPGVRMDAAKQAVTNLVSGLPAGAQLGLIAYGIGTGSSDAEKEAGCRDIKSLVPVGPVDASSFVSTVQGIQASGYTPIGSALRAAAEGLPAEGSRAIVLVSDGIDTCAPPPPCEVAAELAAQGIDLVIHTVGFRVDDAARAELQCIAQATNGTFKDAGDATELDDALRVQVDHAIGGYTAEGQPVSGAAEVGPDAPLLKPGQYVDALEEGTTSFAGFGTEKFYRLEVPTGWTAHVSATISVLPGSDDEGGHTLAISGYLIEQDAITRCGDDHYGSLYGQEDSRSATAVAHSTGCQQPTYLKLRRYGAKFLNTPATMEIVVRYEPPADASGLPAPEVLGVPTAPEHSDTTTPLEGGLSYNQAAELVSGETYESTIISGETRYFKIPVTWGQQISYAVTFTGRDGPDQTGWNPIQLHWANPLRERLADMQTLTNYNPANKHTKTYTDGSDEPVRYGSELFGYDGDYYLSVTSGEPEGALFEQTFLVTVTTPGEIEQGPVYDLSASPTPSPAQSPAGVNPSDAPAPNPGSAPSISPTLIWAIGGTIAAAAAAVGGWLVWRRRK